MDTLYIVIPAYNEPENIAACVADWYPIVERYGGEGSRLVVIDDGSKDDTNALLCGMAKDRPLLIPLTKTNGGHGSAVLYGYRYAIEHGADWIFQTDADGQTNPGEFDGFWNERNRYDAVIGYRTKRGDGAQRAVVEKVVCLLLRLYFGVKVPDANAPFRLMRTEIVKKYIVLDHIVDCDVVPVSGKAEIPAHLLQTPRQGKKLPESEADCEDRMAGYEGFQQAAQEHEGQCAGLTERGKKCSKNSMTSTAT